MTVLKAGIAGYGKMGKIRAATIADMQGVSVEAVYDVDADRLAELDPTLHCASYEELLERDLDLMIVCAFNNCAADYTIRALQRGLHVFCEKPPARTSEELAGVLTVEQQTGLVLKYGFNHRLHYSVMEARKLIDSGELGNLMWMRGVYGKAGSIDYHQEWRTYRKYSGGGILIDQGIHMLDLMRYFSGDDLQAQHAILMNSAWDVESEDNAFVTLTGPQGIVASMHSSATQWRHKFLLEMYFQKGYITLDGILSATRSYAPETMIVGRRDQENITHAMGKPLETTATFEHDHSWKLEMEEFIAAVHGQDLTHGRSTDAMAILQLIESIYDKSGYYDGQHSDGDTA